MMALIKRGESSGRPAIRPLGASLAPAPLSAIDREIMDLHAEIDRVQDKLAERDNAIAQLRLDAEEAVKQAYEMGRTAGLKEAEDRETDRLFAIQDGIQVAQRDLRASLASLERLAPLLARDCLEVILGNPKFQKEALDAALSHQLENVARGSVLNVTVSALDVSDTNAAAALAMSSGLAAGAITVRDKMAAGSCVITLRLGTLEVGVNQQWPAVRSLLEQLALPEDAY